MHATLRLIQEGIENMQHVLGSEFTSCLEYISLLFWWVFSFIENINIKSGVLMVWQVIKGMHKHFLANFVWFHILIFFMLNVLYVQQDI